MSPSSFEKAIRLQFDCLIRKIIDRTVKNYYRELGRRAKHEVPFCDVTEADLNHVAIIDEYSMGYTALSERQRTIVLMSYFLEMSDIEIGEIIGISRCSVYRSRMRALNIIREKYTED